MEFEKQYNTKRVNLSDKSKENYSIGIWEIEEYSYLEMDIPFCASLPSQQKSSTMYTIQIQLKIFCQICYAKFTVPQINTISIFRVMIKTS